MQIAIISDIHEDINSLLKAIEICNKSGIDKIICLGDITGFAEKYYNFSLTRNANESINLINRSCFASVSGNHDLFLIKKVPKYTHSFEYPDDWYLLSFENRIHLSQNKIWTYEDENYTSINEENERFLKSLNEFEVLDFNNIKVFISHYLFPDLSGSTVLKRLTKSRLDTHLSFVKNNECNVSFVGHQHAEGVIIYHKKKSFLESIFLKKMHFIHFGNEGIISNDSVIIVPSIALSNRKSGFVTFDTESRKIRAIKIN